jgi:Lon protease-like protein
MIKIADMSELLTAVECIPLFPLPGAVFIPHTLMPLHVFEERYRDVVDDAMQNEGFLAVPRLRPGWESDYEGQPSIYNTAGFGKIIRYEPMADGRANIVILGLGRISVRSELANDSLYRVAEGVLLSDVFPDRGEAELKAHVHRLRMMVAQVCGTRPGWAERVEPLLLNQTDPVAFVNALAHLTLPDVDARQRYLEIDRVLDRIEVVESLLAGAFTSSVVHA